MCARTGPSWAARILSSLPNTSCAFAYGSAAFRQANHIYTQNTMLDMILVVDDAEAFHRENLKRNPQHYSVMARVAGAHTIAKLQTKMGASIYYNAFVRIDDQVCECGGEQKMYSPAQVRYML
eukprot:m.106841 g.106841  ORF g.106841 m.106841 type:complete len:123 (-) comp15163_c4_seq2:852-1220(-)